MIKVTLYTLLAAICISQCPIALAKDKPSPTYLRQVSIMKRINDAQKAKQLTDKQARELRKDLGKVAEKKQKIRDKNPGQKGAENSADVEERLTKISLRIDELKEANAKKSD
ncbi:MAG: hypothetical protein SGJ27_28550 [Candidatus Melainabacteria bacterium]|mgnify:CR=1 FL=1|nr:hypothetical protein [Candidatus Melainabacteria bacterium]